eukprot:CAMPEP_0119135196 /NCGR_PEP_ID=MMETSP1310-20130426/18851_1 /TAXON_ID=464262 /ORGANISM="Genus nov. species nov., Strain RCC2339" /LENGTH=367 /DNA_ID=CAMNT_0007126057 /DNA_START=80 /DNA_END=1179 /DNA_ORIENTATION=+
MPSSSWGLTYPLALHVYNIQYPLRVFQFRQQAQQHFYPWHNRTFAWSDFYPFSRSDLALSGSNLRMVSNMLCSTIRNVSDPYHPLKSQIQSFMASDEEGSTVVMADEEEEMAGDTVLQYASLAISTTVATTVLHPVVVMSTWEIVQDKGRPKGFFLSPSTWFSAVREDYKAYEGMRAAKKSFFDGLGATIMANVCFEILKFGIGRKLGELIGVRSRDKEIDELEKSATKDHDVNIRVNARRRNLVLRWRRLATVSFVNYLSGVTAELVTYPLKTVAIKLQAQNASFRFPVSYHGGFDCMSRVVHEEGWGSLYSGMTTLVFSMLPECFMAGATYVGVILAIEACSDSTRVSLVLPAISALEHGDDQLN